MVEEAPARPRSWCSKLDSSFAWRVSSRELDRSRTAWQIAREARTRSPRRRALIEDDAPAGEGLPRVEATLSRLAPAGHFRVRGDSGARRTDEPHRRVRSSSAFSAGTGADCVALRVSERDATNREGRGARLRPEEDRARASPRKSERSSNAIPRWATRSSRVPTTRWMQLRRGDCTDPSHERVDGKGYPNGLAGDELPLEGRIAAVADVFDALTHERVYRPAFSLDEALQMVRDGKRGRTSMRPSWRRSSRSCRRWKMSGAYTRTARPGSQPSRRTGDDLTRSALLIVDDHDALARGTKMVLRREDSRPPAQRTPSPRRAGMLERRDVDVVSARHRLRWGERVGPHRGSPQA